MNLEQTPFDRPSVVRHRHRATSAGMFLQTLARDELKESLKDVNRTFTAPAVVTAFPDVWSDFLPGAKVVEDADHLDLVPGAHDLLVHGLSLHWSNDPVGQLVQMRHALQPDGLCLAVMFGGQTLHELRTSLAEAEARVAGGLSPRIAPMGEIRDLGGLLQRAGFALPVADSLVQSVSYPSAFHLMQDLRAMGETNALSQRPKGLSRKDLFEETARIYSETFSGDDDRIAATFELIFLTGWAPDANQPQPLRPGSAMTRLADALDTFELGPDGKPAKGKKE